MGKYQLSPEHKAKKREYMRQYREKKRAAEGNVAQPKNIPAPASLAEQIRFKLNALDTQIQALKVERDGILQDLRVILTDIELQSVVVKHEGYGVCVQSGS